MKAVNHIKEFFQFWKQPETKADSLYMTLDAFKEAHSSKNKELFLIDGATHIETYWKPQYVDQAMGKLTEFFGNKFK